MLGNPLLWFTGVLTNLAKAAASGEAETTWRSSGCCAKRQFIDKNSTRMMKL